MVCFLMAKGAMCSGLSAPHRAGLVSFLRPSGPMRLEPSLCRVDPESSAHWFRLVRAPGIGGRRQGHRMEASRHCLAGPLNGAGGTEATCCHTDRRTKRTIRRKTSGAKCAKDSSVLASSSGSAAPWPLDSVGPLSLEVNATFLASVFSWVSVGYS